MDLARHPVLIVVTAVVSVLAASRVLAQTIGTAGAADPPRLLWSDPGPVAARDLRWGTGSADRAPKGPFTFVEKNTGGTQPKIVVVDGRGVTWDVKFGVEAKAEVAASRIVHALGYFTEEVYFVPSGQIQGAADLEGLGGHITGAGGFSNARFRRGDGTIAELEEEWTFHDNPFKGSRELSGLLILMTMLNNWDIRGPANNEVLRVAKPDGTHEIRYLVGDLGATFGRMGGRISSRSKWNLEDYREEGFIERVEGGTIHLDYDGFDSNMDRVPLDHARWFATFAVQLTPDQVRTAFQAAGASQDEVDGFSGRLLQKIAELQEAVR